MPDTEEDLMLDVPWSDAFDPQPEYFPALSESEMDELYEEEEAIPPREQENMDPIVAVFCPHCGAANGDMDNIKLLPLICWQCDKEIIPFGWWYRVAIRWYRIKRAITLKIREIKQWIFSFRKPVISSAKDSPEIDFPGEIPF